VDKQTDKYFTYTQLDWFRDEAEIRAAGTESAGSGFRMSTDSYACDVRAFHKDVPRDVVNNADDAINPLSDATEFVSQKMLLKQESDWITAYMSTGVWDNEATPSNLWSDYANSDPIADIESEKETILQNTGNEPNTLVLGYRAWRQLKHHPDFVDRIKHTSPDGVTPMLIANLLDIDRVLVAKAIKSASAEGSTAPTYSFFTGEDALLAYVNPNPGLLQPSAGYNFVWTGVSDGLGAQVGVSQFPIARLKVQRVEGERAYDFKVVGAGLGSFFNGAVST
jgi:hypothetical protein